VDKAGSALSALARFFRTPLADELARHTTESPAARALELFRATAQSVPAYAEFLREAGFDPGAVQSVDDFARVPVATKETYHRRHALSALCRDGELSACDMLAVSSGSTGE